MAAIIKTARDLRVFNETEFNTKWIFEIREDAGSTFTGAGEGRPKNLDILSSRCEIKAIFYPKLFKLIRI